MCYVHVTALVAEYLTRKGKDTLEPREARDRTACTIGFLAPVAALSCPHGQSPSPSVTERTAGCPSFVLLGRNSLISLPLAASDQLTQAERLYFPLRYFPTGTAYPSVTVLRGSCWMEFLECNSAD